MDREMLDAIMARTVAEGTLAGRMGITIVSASASQVVATMPVAGNTQPQGLLHGGASCVLAETAGSLGAFLHASAGTGAGLGADAGPGVGAGAGLGAGAGPGSGTGAGRTVVGIEISATHHLGIRDGEITAVATLAHGGRTLASYDIVVTDAGGHRVCTARLTCLIRDQAPGMDPNGAS